MKSLLSKKEKAILIGLYLSKFDNEGLKELGFNGMIQAFNVLGYSLGIKPASIKNYRDEFDPYFNNNRKGWHKRDLRDYCKKIMKDFSSLNLLNFTELIKSFLINNYEIEKLFEKYNKQDKSESVAKRLITGKSAEEYFKINYKTINQFKDYILNDTTNMACGFDFKLIHSANYFCVEVKGLNKKKGNILMTEKEYYVANELKQKYCLFIVFNFSEKPYHEYIFDPLNSKLIFKKTVKIIKQINYATQI